MEQQEFHAATPSTAWTTITPGIAQLVLNEDPSTGRRTLLQRWDPSTTNSPADQVFVHDYVEEIYMVDGDLFDITLGEGWSKGAYAYRKPGMRHGPFRSEGGCLMFILCIPVGEDGKEAKA